MNAISSKSESNFERGAGIFAATVVLLLVSLALHCKVSREYQESARPSWKHPFVSNTSPGGEQTVFVETCLKPLPENFTGSFPVRLQTPDAFIGMTVSELLNALGGADETSTVLDGSHSSSRRYVYWLQPVGFRKYSREGLALVLIVVQGRVINSVIEIEPERTQK